MNASVVVLVLAALAALAAARPQQVPVGFVQQPRVIGLVQRTETRDAHGQLSLSYLDEAGTALTEHGALRQVQDGEYRGDYVLDKKGSYSYISPEGRVIKVEYTADENGFRPISDAIPVPVAPLH